MSENIPPQPSQRQTAAKLIEDDSESEQLILTQTTKKHYIANVEFQLAEPSQHYLRVMVGFSKSHLLNLREGREKQDISLEHRKQDLIFRRDFQLDHFKFVFEVYNASRSGGAVKICLNILQRVSRKKFGVSDLVVHYYERSVWKSEMLQVVDSDRSTASADQYWFSLYDFMKYVDERNVFFEIRLKYRNLPLSSLQRRYCGLENVGNTCYMNSFLQALYFIKPLRKALFECHSTDNAFVKALQTTFAEMMQSNGAIISPEAIVHASDWSRDFLFNQQDIDEFKRHLFGEVQKVNKDILDMFQVESVSTVQCKDVDYRNETVTTSMEIELNLTDHQYRTLDTVTKSLDLQCREERLESEVDTERYGHRVGYKTLRYTKLPQVLFLNLRRYEYTRGQMQKIVSKFMYEREIDLSSFVDGSNDYRYVLYGVLVHKGNSATSGHYYSFINVSGEANKPSWYKFNDSQVTEVEESEAIEDNYGGPEKCFRFSTESEQFLKETSTRLATAYILIYMRTRDFNNMQQTILSIPASLQKVNGSGLASTHGTGDEVMVVLADDLIEKVDGIFNSKVFSLGHRVVINLNESLASQLPQVTAGFEKTDGTLWRVSLTKRNVTNVLREYCNQAVPAKYMLFGDHPKPAVDKFYLLFVPNKHNVQVESARLSHLIACNDLIITFVQRSWQEHQGYRIMLESMQVYPKAKRNSVLTELLETDHTDKLLFRKGKILSLDTLQFPRNEAYCELARSFLRVDLKQHDQSFEAMEKSFA